MSIPSVNVTVQVFNQTGDPIEGAKVFAVLQGIEKYNGFVLQNVNKQSITDENGEAILSVFPNELGTESSEYLFRIVNPITGKVTDMYASVPNSDCLLHQIVELDRFQLRGAGEIITAEVAGYATDAADAASEASNSASDAENYSNISYGWAVNPVDVIFDDGIHLPDYSSKHYASKSSDSAIAAGISADSAATSETNAGISEANATASELKAEQWAEEDEDVEVEVGKYSAKHYALKAEEFANQTIPSASEIAVTPAGNISSTDVQSALEELDSEKANSVHTHSTTDITSFNETVRDVVGNMATDSSTTSIVYDDNNDTIQVDVKSDSSKQKIDVSLNDIKVGTRSDLNFKDGTNTTVSVTDDEANNRVDVNVDVSEESIQDVSGGMFTGNTESGITTTYNDTTGKVDIDVNSFDITLDGDVSGSTTVSGLSNATITVTIPDVYVSNSGDTIDGDLVITGDLTVNGTTTTINTEELNVADNIVRLNSDFLSGLPVSNAGIEIKRGDSPVVSLIWNETTDKWQITTDGSTYEEIITPSYTYSQSEINIKDTYISAGMVAEPSLVNNLNGTVAVGTGNARLYNAAYHTGNINEYTVTGGTYSLVDNSINYIIVNYNSGTPIYQSTTDVLTINESDVIPVYTIYRSGTQIFTIGWDSLASGLPNKLHKRFVKTRRFEAEPGGLVLTEYGTRNLNLTSGIVWVGAKELSLSEVNSIDNDFSIFYHVAGVWYKDDTYNAYDNFYYDDGTDRVELLPERYAVNWIYRCVCSENRFVGVLGTGNYTLSDALSSQPPANLPDNIRNIGYLVGRVVVEKNSDTAYAIEVPQAFIGNTTGAVSSVNGLTGDVSLDTDNISEGSNLYFTPERAVEAIADVTKEPTGYDRENIETTGKVSFDNATRTFTIEPQDGETEFYYYDLGVKYTHTTAQTVVIDDTEGIHAVYFEGNTLTSTTVLTDEITFFSPFTAYIYWDATNKIAVGIGDERHGIIMDGHTHKHFHEGLGSLYYSGLGLGDILVDENGSLDTHSQFSITNGVFTDEDITFNISGYNINPANIDILYKSGTEGYWRLKSADDYPLIYSGTAGYTGANGRIPYNEWTGTTWRLTEVTNNDFIVMLYFASNGINGNNIIGIQGQNEYGTAGEARLGALTELDGLVSVGLPFAEFVPIGAVIFQTSSTFSNTPQAAIVSTDEGLDYIDLRSVQSGNNSSSSVNDHGNLTGLGDDDHPQYLNITRVETWFNTKVLDDISDVDAPTPSDGQVLTYNSTSGNWEATTPAGSGDMLKSVYDTNDNGIVDVAESANSVEYDNVQNKPTVFPVQVEKDGVLVGQQSTLNFIEGSGVTLTTTDDGANGEIDITISATGSGDMLKSVYDTNDNGIVDVAESANSVEYTNVQNKPSSFPTTIKNNDSTVGTRSNLNFLPGSNVSYTITDDGTDIDITINATDTNTNQFIDLLDTDFTGLVDGDFVKYNSTSGNWEVEHNVVIDASYVHTDNNYTTTEKTKLAGIEESANNYTLPVASATLGGVKSGTDITVDGSGNVSVNDDSHNHIIDNIDGLQTALDGITSSMDGLTDTDLTTPQAGDILVYDGDSWNNTPLPVSENTVRQTYTYTATEGQTTFSCYYVAGHTDVYFKTGTILIEGTDYTGIAGTSITLATGATAGDEVLIVSYIPVSDILSGDLDNLSNVDNTGVTDGSVLVYNTTSGNWEINNTNVTDSDIGVTVQAFDADIVSDASYVHTDNNYTTTEKNKLAGIEDNANNYVISKSDVEGVLTGTITSHRHDTSTVNVVSSHAVDCSAGTYFTDTATGGITLTFNNVPTGAYIMAIEMTHTDGTITFPASVKWGADTAPTLTEGTVHLFFFVTDDGGTTWRGSAIVDYAS